MHRQGRNCIEYKTALAQNEAAKILNIYNFRRATICDIRNKRFFGYQK